MFENSQEIYMLKDEALQIGKWKAKTGCVFRSCFRHWFIYVKKWNRTPYKCHRLTGKAFDEIITRHVHPVILIILSKRYVYRHQPKTYLITFRNMIG